ARNFRGSIPHWRGSKLGLIAVRDFDPAHDRNGSFASVERYPWHVCFTLDSGRIAHCREPT
ncbi:MAG: hypothetical protein WA662_00535, partial [Pseudolabrys sp.]